MSRHSLTEGGSQVGQGAVAVRVEGLVKRFGDVRALDGVSFEVGPGKVLGLLGPNGAGKTTIIRVLATILAPDGGIAEVMGRDVTKNPGAVRQTLGLAGQYAAVDAVLTGRENLRLVARLSRVACHEVGPRADALLERFGLEEAGDRLVRTYSGGMRRRLDLPVALVHRPPVLLLDEPTTGLDLQSRSELWATIRELLADGTVVLLTTQYLEEADRLADQLVMVDHGRVIESGPPAELKARLGSAIAQLGFTDERHAARAADAASAAGITRSTRDGRDLRFNAANGASALIEILKLLDADGLTPTTLALREPSLDDVFLALTGHATEHTT